MEKLIVQNAFDGCDSLTTKKKRKTNILYIKKKIYHILKKI